MVPLNDLVGAVIPERQPLDLHQRIDIGSRPAPILSSRCVFQRKGILMIDRQWTAG